MSTPTPRTDAAYAEWQSSWTRTPFGPDFARTLERELATERDIVSRIWVQLGSPTYEQLKGRSIYDLIDEMRAELATEREKAERYRLASLKLDAELATERARLDWLESDAGMEFQWETTKVITRAAIDAAMKEGA